MRRSIVASGVALLALGSYYLLYPLVAPFTLSAGLVTLLLGLKASKGVGVTIGTGQADSPAILVDRAVMGASIYQLAFFDSKLVLKRLASSRMTILLVMVLAATGLLVDAYIVGALAGGVTGYAVQEYTTQRNRQKIIREKNLALTRPGDVEFSYKDLKEVVLRKNRLFLAGERRRARLSLPRGYSQRMSPKLRTILPGKYKDQLVDSANTSDKQDK